MTENWKLVTTERDLPARSQSIRLYLKAVPCPDDIREQVSHAISAWRVGEGSWDELIAGAVGRLGSVQLGLEVRTVTQRQETGHITEHIEYRLTTNLDPGAREPAKIRLAIGHLAPEERRAIRELVGDTPTFLDPSVTLPQLRPYLCTDDREPEVYADPADGRNMNEEIDVALFAYGLGKMRRLEVLYAMGERAGGDAVLYVADREGEAEFDRVQVKGIRAREVSGATLNEEISKLGTKYEDMIVVMALHLEAPNPLKDFRGIPEGVKVGQLYVLTATDPSLKTCQLIGDLAEERVGYEKFDYPE